MKIYKKLIALVLSMSMVLSMTACEEDENESGGGDTSNTNLENKKIVWLAWYNPFEKDPAYQLFKERYGGEIEYVSTGGYASRFDKLSNMIKNDQSPDMFPFEMNNWPYGAKMFQPVDELIDFNEDKWASTKDYIDQFKWKGKAYTPITEIDTSFVLWYRKSVVQKAGLADPKELFDKG